MKPCGRLAELGAFRLLNQPMVDETGGKSLGDNGFARIVVPSDKAGGRFVSNIARIEIRDAGK